MHKARTEGNKSQHAVTKVSQGLWRSTDVGYRSGDGKSLHSVNAIHDPENSANPENLVNPENPENP